MVRRPIGVVEEKREKRKCKNEPISHVPLLPAWPENLRTPVSPGLMGSTTSIPGPPRTGSPPPSVSAQHQPHQQRAMVRRPVPRQDARLGRLPMVRMEDVVDPHNARHTAPTRALRIVSPQRSTTRSRVFQSRCSPRPLCYPYAHPHTRVYGASSIRARAEGTDITGTNCAKVLSIRATLAAESWYIYGIADGPNGSLC